MKKIEPVAWQYRAKVIGGTVTTEWRSCCFSEYKLHKQEKYNEVVHYEVRQLYTREALETVAHSAVLATFEAIRDGGNYPAGADMPDIDTAAIINQLTGE